ncbi:MAG: hypothetical protein JNK82_45925 [Myxococcaceae bacterium]|nr:hypothetical protein [Myxococcaceae bacterium]
MMPRWVAVTLGAAAAGLLLLGATCFVREEWLFGPDAFRTLTRIPIGLLGGATLGLGGSTLMALRARDVNGLRALARAMVTAAAFVPPVVAFNIGAFDSVATGGARTLVFIVVFVALVAAPLLACLRVLGRLSAR